MKSVGAPIIGLLFVNTGSRTLNISPPITSAATSATTGGDALAFKNPNGTIVTVMYVHRLGDGRAFAVTYGRRLCDCVSAL